MVRVGLVALDRDSKWIGGRYYLHHLIRCVRSQVQLTNLRFCDVWWGEAGTDEAFGEVRDLIDESVVIRPPSRFGERALRFMRRRLVGSEGAADLFRANGVSALFPIPPCEQPGIPYVFWLADFQYLHLPELFGPELVAFYEGYFARHVRDAAAVVLSSEHAAADFARIFPQSVSKSRIVKFCSVPTSEWWAESPGLVAQKYGLPDAFFILSNQFSHHKNHAVVFEGVRILRDRGVDIVVVCTGSTFGFRGADYFEKIAGFIQRYSLEGQIRILGLVPRADQIALARGAVAVLQPSQFEGWSTVIEDARSLGKRILASDIPVHAEQLAGSAQALLPLDDPQAWADALHLLLSNRSECDSSSTTGPDVVALETRMADCATAFSSAINLALS